MYRKILEISKGVEKDVITFAQKLIQTPSISGAEKAVADLCMNKMTRLGYDEVFRDGAGNIVGIVKGTGDGKNIMYNSHMDHVDPGAPKNWKYDPYGGIIDGGYIHGRAASDVKGGLAAQIYAGAVLKKLGKLKGDFIFTGVVQEEPAEMFGMEYLCTVTLKEKGIRFDLMVSSEATNMNVYLGHRGRAEMEVITYGRACHGSAPWRGINAIYKMVPIIEAVPKIYETLPADDFLGKASLAVTIISCSPGRFSIIPDVCTLSLDRRLLPGETAEDAMRPIKELIGKLSRQDPEFKAEVKIRSVVETSYTGYTKEATKFMNAWSVDRNHEFVKSAFKSLGEVGQNPGIGKWDFCTDASFVTGILGIPSIGYSPMEEQYAHTPADRVKVQNIIDAVAGNAAIAYGICNK